MSESAQISEQKSYSSKKECVLDMIRQGIKGAMEIVRRCGCSRAYVYKVLKELHREEAVAEIAIPSIPVPVRREIGAEIYIVVKENEFSIKCSGDRDICRGFRILAEFVLRIANEYRM